MTGPSIGGNGRSDGKFGPGARKVLKGAEARVEQGARKVLKGKRPGLSGTRERCRRSRGGATGSGVEIPMPGISV